MTSRVEGFGFRFYVRGVRGEFVTQTAQANGCCYESSPMLVLWGLIETGDEATKDAATALMEQLNAGEIIEVVKHYDSSNRLEYYSLASKGYTDKGRRYYPPSAPTPEEPEAVPLQTTRRLRFPKR